MGFNSIESGQRGRGYGVAGAFLKNLKSNEASL